jgi:hypothetical protein
MNQILFTLFIKIEHDSSFQNGGNSAYAVRCPCRSWLFNQLKQKKLLKKKREKESVSIWKPQLVFQVQQNKQPDSKQ